MFLQSHTWRRNWETPSLRFPLQHSEPCWTSSPFLVFLPRDCRGFTLASSTFRLAHHVNLIIYVSEQNYLGLLLSFGKETTWHRVCEKSGGGWGRGWGWEEHRTCFSCSGRRGSLAPSPEHPTNLEKTTYKPIFYRYFPTFLLIKWD